MNEEVGEFLAKQRCGRETSSRSWQKLILVCTLPRCVIVCRTRTAFCVTIYVYDYSALECYYKFLSFFIRELEDVKSFRIMFTTFIHCLIDINNMRYEMNLIIKSHMCFFVCVKKTPYNLEKY